jgi:hypothetical protein
MRGKREPREALEEVPHALPAQRDLHADRVAGADTELGDRTLGAGHDRLLAGDELDVADGGIHGLRVREGASPRPMLTTIFSSPRHLVRVAVAELLQQRRHGLR